KSFHDRLYNGRYLLQQLVSQVSLLILLFFESLREFVLHFEQDPQLINGHNLLVVELLYSHRILQLFLPHLLTFVILFQRLPLDCMLFRLISLHDTSLIMILEFLAYDKNNEYGNKIPTYIYFLNQCHFVQSTYSDVVENVDNYFLLPYDCLIHYDYKFLFLEPIVTTSKTNSLLPLRHKWHDDVV